MKCPKCGNSRIVIQAVSVTRTKRHGAAWWIFIGWWIWMFWLLFFLPMLIIRLIQGKKVESKVHSEGVCQNCGHHWRIKKPVLNHPATTPGSNAPRFDTLVPNIQTALGQILNDDVGVSISEDDWTISNNGLRYNIQSTIWIGGSPKFAAAEIYFPDETYDTFHFSQLRIDGSNIEC